MVSFDEVSKTDFTPPKEQVELIPASYEKNEMGIFQVSWKEDNKGNNEKILIPLSYTPFTITQQMENPDTKEVFLEISFGQKNIIVSASDVSNKKGIIKLAGYGVLTVESNAKSLCKYIMEMRNLNHIPQTLIYDRFGWKEDGSYVLGGERYTKDNHSKVSLTIKSRQTDAVTQRGTIEGWMKTIKGLMDYNTQRFKMYVGSAAPLLKILDESNVCLNDFGDTSVGKTVTTLCSMSIYGDPYDLLFSGDSTKVGMERTVTLFCDMPINLDDAQNIDKKQLNDIIYMLVNGVGKIRGAKEGGTQEVLSWRTSGLFTSEVPLLTEDAKGGLGARLIEVSKGLGRKDEKAVSNFEDDIKQHHGVFAPLLINYILHNPEEIKKIHKNSKKILEQARGKYVFDNLSMGIAGRLSNTYATILTAGVVFEKLYESIGGSTKDPQSIITDVFSKNVQKQGAETYAIRGLNHILSWIAANKTSFLLNGCRETSEDGRDRRYKILGDITLTHYFLIPTELRAELDRAKFSLDRLLEDFKERGYLESDKGKNQKTCRIEGTAIKTYCLKRECVDILSVGDEK